MKATTFENMTGFRTAQEAVVKMKSKPICLLIDDDKVDYRAEIVARTFETGLQLLTIFEIDYLILDHDLGYTDGKNGATFLEFMLYSGIYPKTIELNSLNPVGLNNMRRILKNYGMYDPVSNYLVFKRKDHDRG